MKLVAHSVVLALLCNILGCGAPSDGPSTHKAIPKDATKMELMTGGIYAAKNDEGKYTLTKILVLDDLAVHARFYNEEFDDLPTTVSSDDLTFLIGHAPLAREGFLSEHRDLVTVEDVSESELEGYRLYLEAMRGN
jgi:hypothetical protein